MLSPPRDPSLIADRSPGCQSQRAFPNFHVKPGPGRVGDVVRHFLLPHNLTEMRSHSKQHLWARLQPEAKGTEGVQGIPLD